MSTTVHAHPRPDVRSPRAPLVTLGWRHFAVLIVVLLLFGDALPDPAVAVHHALAGGAWTAGPGA